MKSLFLDGSILEIPKSMSQLTRLKHLVISSNAVSSEMDLSILQNCKKLEILYLKGGNLINLDTLKSFVNLKKLYIDASKTRILDLSPILECKKIEELIVKTDCTTFILGDLSSLSKLKKVDIDNIMGQTNLDSLGSLPNLKELNIVQKYHQYDSSVPNECISNSNYPTTRLEFKSFKKLEKLAFTGRSLLVTFKEGSLPNLQELDACTWGGYTQTRSRGWGRGNESVWVDNKIENIRGIEHLRSLKIIHINIRNLFSTYNTFDGRYGHNLSPTPPIMAIQNLFRLKRIEEILVTSSNNSVQESDFVNLIPKDLKCTRLRKLELRGVLLENIPSSIQKCKKLESIHINIKPKERRWGASDLWPIFDSNGISDFDMKIPPQIVKCSNLETINIEGMNIYKQFPYESFMKYGQQIRVRKSSSNGMEVEELQTNNISDKLFDLFLSSPIIVTSEKPKELAKRDLFKI